MKLEYPYTVEKDPDGNLLVRFVDLDEAFTEGRTLEEAAFNAQEVLSLVLEQRIEDDQEIPLPSKANTGHKIAPDATVQAAALVRLARQGGNKTFADMARAMDTSWASVQRLENARHSVSLSQLERAAGALGHRLVLSFEGQAGPAKTLTVGRIKGKLSTPAIYSKAVNKYGLVNRTTLVVGPPKRHHARKSTSGVEHLAGTFLERKPSDLRSQKQREKH